MIYKGINFTKSRKVVSLPKIYRENPEYVAFGRICSKDTVGAIKTNRKWVGRSSPYRDNPEFNKDGEKIYPVYAKKVESDGYSMTNMMYGKDGYIYLLYKSSIYVSKIKK